VEAVAARVDPAAEWAAVAANPAAAAVVVGRVARQAAARVDRAAAWAVVERAARAEARVAPVVRAAARVAVAAADRASQTPRLLDGSAPHLGRFFFCGAHDSQ
jgi:hypothetical protein